MLYRSLRSLVKTVRSLRRAELGSARYNRSANLTNERRRAKLDEANGRTTITFLTFVRAFVARLKHRVNNVFPKKPAHCTLP